MKLLSEHYNPQEVESKIYQQWEQQKAFKAEDISTKLPYCIILPPPNVTGFLHIGHALDHFISDCLIRWKRMSGFNTLWLPGIDHAGISTQTVVEKKLAEEGLTRKQLGREAFLKKVWDWKHQYGNRIYEQMRRLGNSLDWDRAVFTLDAGVSRAVRKVFVELYKKKYIYRGLRLVNWSGPLETAVSDLEVEFKEVKGSLWYLRYPISNSSEELIVATTRPETFLGDTAVCVHPNDERYQKFIGNKVLLPLINREIPIIADESIDPNFGSGVVKVTPAHDFNDYKLAKKHNLDFINILDKKCILNENAGIYKGLSVIQARKKIIQDLKDQNYLIKEEPHIHKIGHCSRTDAVIEPFLSEQWFVKMQPMVSPAKAVVESGSISIQPESWVKVYLHWLNNIEDWCISRQLWWGHRIPAWYCKDCGHINVQETDPESCEKCYSKNIYQDEDVLDTWFSSALWPFSTLGWPENTEALKTFYPTSTMITGHDILFFWVARMIIMGLEFVKDVPFRKVYLHGILRDHQGRKMSKSLGNSVDPVKIIDRYGADALRFSFLAHIHTGKDFKFSEERVQGYRNFINKIWNATRYVLSKVSLTSIEKLEGPLYSSFDAWILQKLLDVEKTVEDALEELRFSDAATALYQFIWHEFCDWYIEFTKPIFNHSSEEKTQTEKVMLLTLDRILKLLHPFAPFVTEELYQNLPHAQGLCMLANYPNIRMDKQLKNLCSKDAVFEVELIKSILHVIRNIRGENRISPGSELIVKLKIFDEKTQKILSSYRKLLSSLGRISELEIAPQIKAKKAAVESISLEQSIVKVIVPLTGLVDFEQEISRISKNLEKLQKNITNIQTRLQNPHFIKNANPEVIEADRQQFNSLNLQIHTLTSALKRLQIEEEQWIE